MPVPNTFAGATAAIPLAQLDQNFATTITLGNTAIQLGNTVSTLNNMTLANVTINSVSTPITAAQGGTGLVSITSNGVMIGNGTGSITTVSPGTNGNVLTSNGTAWISQAPTSAGDVTKSGNNAFTGTNTFYNSSGQTFGTATSTQDGIVIGGRAGGSSSYRLTFAPGTLSANRTVTFPDGGGNYTVGYRNIPAVGTQTGSYTLATGDVGKYVQVGSGGSITIPDATFAEGDVVSIFNNTTGSITLTCSITTAYIAGTNTDKATMSLATRGMATVFFISSTVCVVSGNVS